MLATAEEPVAMQKAVEGGLRTFTIVAAGQLVSILGSQLTAFGLGLWIFKTTGSVTFLGLILLAATLPGILISPLAGTIIDRSDRRRVMLASNCVSAIVEGVLWAMIVGGQRAPSTDGRLGYFFLLAMVISVADAFQDPAFTASVPLLVPKRLLSQASGFVQFSQALARILAPGLAGVMLEKVDLGPILLVDACTFLVAAATLLAVRIPRPAGSMAASRDKGSLWRDARAGWIYLHQRTGLVALLILFSAVNFIVASVNVIYIPLILSFATADTAGMVMCVSGVGMLVGSITVMRLGTPKRKVAGIMGLLVLGGVAIGLTGVRPSAPLVAACGFATMFVLPVLQASSQVLWQTKVALEVQGRVFSLRRMISQATLPAAFLTAGWLADSLFEPLMREGGPLAPWLGPWIGMGPGRGIGLLFIVAGIAGCLLAAAGYAYPRIRHLEAELPDMIADTLVVGRGATR